MQDGSNSLVPLCIGNFRILEQPEDIFNEIVSTSKRGFWIYDLKNSQLYISNGKEAFTIRDKRNTSEQAKKVLNQEDYDYLVETIKEIVKAKDKGFSLKVNLRNGKWILISAVVIYDNNTPDKIIGFFEDVTAEVGWDINANRYIELLAYYDDVTKLPNKYYINEIIEERIERAKKVNSNFWIMFIEINELGMINELFGHRVGDKFLEAVSLEIKKKIPREWILGRFGGDEFVIVTTCAKKEFIVNKCLELIDSFTKAWNVMGKTFFANINIGIAGYPEDGKNFSELLKNAEAALTQAKKNAREFRKRQYEFYSTEITESILQRLELETEILEGIQKRQFFLVYQPKFSIDTHQVTGFEALLRWNSNGGILTPDKFLSVAEESGLIYELNKLIVDTLCSDLHFLKEEGLDTKPIAINLSGKEFAFYNMIANLREALKKYNLSPSDIEIEVTEKTILKDIELSMSAFRKLNDLGIKIYIDDFGTGFSSLELLLNLPINALKIDKKFIDRIDFYEKEYAIVKSIIHMAKELNLKTVAEGVERKEQYDILKELGCDEVQGYLFAKPMKIEEIVDFLKGMH